MLYFPHWSSDYWQFQYSIIFCWSIAYSPQIGWIPAKYGPCFHIYTSADNFQWNSSL